MKPSLTGAGVAVVSVVVTKRYLGPVVQTGRRTQLQLTVLTSHRPQHLLLLLLIFLLLLLLLLLYTSTVREVVWAAVRVIASTNTILKNEQNGKYNFNFIS